MIVSSTKRLMFKVHILILNYFAFQLLLLPVSCLTPIDPTTNSF